MELQCKLTAHSMISSWSYSDEREANLCVLEEAAAISSVMRLQQLESVSKYQVSFPILWKTVLLHA